MRTIAPTVVGQTPIRPSASADQHEADAEVGREPVPADEREGERRRRSGRRRPSPRSGSRGPELPMSSRSSAVTTSSTRSAPATTVWHEVEPDDHARRRARSPSTRKPATISRSIAGRSPRRRLGPLAAPGAARRGTPTRASVSASATKTQPMLVDGEQQAAQRRAEERARRSRSRSRRRSRRSAPRAIRARGGSSAACAGRNVFDATAMNAGQRVDDRRRRSPRRRRRAMSAMATTRLRSAASITRSRRYAVGEVREPRRRQRRGDPAEHEHER